MKNCVSILVALLLMSRMAVLAEDVVQKKAEAGSTVFATRMEAASLAANRSGGLFMLEGWEEDVVHIPDSFGGRLEMRQFPREELVEVNTSSTLTLQTFEQVALLKGLKRANPRHDSFIVEALATDPRWPLNWKVGDEFSKPLSCGEVLDLLYSKYHLFQDFHGDGVTNLCTADNFSSPAWIPPAGGQATVRDVVIQLLERGKKPGEWYFIKIMPDFDPRSGLAAIKDRPVLRWQIAPRRALTVSELKTRQK